MNLLVVHFVRCTGYKILSDFVDFFKQTSSAVEKQDLQKFA